jgi:hypothetical protein
MKTIGQEFLLDDRWFWNPVMDEKQAHLLMLFYKLGVFE